MGHKVSFDKSRKKKRGPTKGTLQYCEEKAEAKRCKKKMRSIWGKNGRSC